MGYLSSLGRAQTANVKRDAAVGVANANRDAGIRVSDFFFLHQSTEAVSINYFFVVTVTRRAGGRVREGFDGRQVQRRQQSRRQHTPLQAPKVAVRPRGQHSGTSNPSRTSHVRRLFRYSTPKLSGNSLDQRNTFKMLFLPIYSDFVSCVWLLRCQKNSFQVHAGSRTDKGHSKALLKSCSVSSAFQ